MRELLYFDNAATSFPKPPAVLEAMVRYMQELGAPGRGLYAPARDAAALIDRCRERIATLLNVGSPRHVIFTLNCTDAMNLGIRGTLGSWRRRHPGRVPHVVTSALDHNSFLRPLLQMSDRGEIRLTIVPFDPGRGVIDPREVIASVGADTALVALLHASNVTGLLQPLEPIGRVCRERGVMFLVDAAQSAGHAPVDMQALGADLLAVAGHKGLLGPTGTGALCLRPGAEEHLETCREGGTGSRIELDRQPRELPDRYEPGSHNTMGIIGLSAGVQWLLDQDVRTLHRRERALTRMMLEAFGGAVPGLRVLGPLEARDRIGVVSVVHESIPPMELARRLELEHGLLVRAGLHCAPHAHRQLGTTREVNAPGAVRFSIGPLTQRREVERAIEAVRAVCGVGRGASVGGAAALTRSGAGTAPPPSVPGSAA
jgi:cysteine desulfurase/selenocysteine lyase